MLLVKPKINKQLKVNQNSLSNALAAYSGTMQELRNALNDLTIKHESGIEPVILTTRERIYLVAYKAGKEVHPIRLISPKKIVDWTSDFTEEYQLNRKLARFSVLQETDLATIKEAIDGWDVVYRFIVDSDFVKKLVANVQNNKV